MRVNIVLRDTERSVIELDMLQIVDATALRKDGDTGWKW
jgi:hypothetical protein